MIYLILGMIFGLLWATSDESESMDPDDFPEYDLGGEA